MHENVHTTHGADYVPEAVASAARATERIERIVISGLDSMRYVVTCMST